MLKKLTLYRLNQNHNSICKGHNLMDWSISGQMAVSFGQDVIVFHNELETTMVYSVTHPGALKYSPNGRYLALGCRDFNYPILELWKLQPGQEFLVINGKYLQKWIKSVRCIEWSNDSEKIVCGTECGLILVLSVCSLRTLHRIRNHKHKIQCIRYSPNGQYLATADVKGEICIFHSKQYQLFMGFCFKTGDIAFDWHPWSNVELAVSEKSPASIYIFHVPRREIVAFYRRTNKKVLINSINYSKITGELLVNVYRYDNNGCPCCEILVLSSLNRVVDILGHQEGNLFFMMWSPDGSKLAGAGLDESFSIWNFYPKDKIDAKANKKKSCDVKQRSSLELYTLFK
ncbi:protein cortex isoform X2 [Drosophila innubila]|uniref:protein cortex isoform X2 n=1 Tax=Drosophila innubila TaxID=198719 RepID=UPI00148BCC24|nr:protein cortex isoform X2 [Drosophila innubila]